MNILISNDDGYRAPGIMALAAALRSIGNVTVVAPDRNRSGASNSLTLSNPVTVAKVEDGVFAVEGTPSDCILVAFGGLLDSTPDIIVSGINDGPNMGDDTLYSGTVAAATEGRFLDLPPIAVSMAAHAPTYFDTAAQVVLQLISGLHKNEFNNSTVLNVNVPDLPYADLKGLTTTRLGSRHAPAPAKPHSNPRGAHMYWLGPAGEVNDNGPGTDFYAVEQGYVSITPLQTDLTNHDLVTPVQAWLDDSVIGNENTGSGENKV